MRDSRTDAKKIEQQREQREIQMKMQEEMAKRMNRVVKKIGKKDMARSEKVRVKMEEKKVEIDEDTAD